MYEAEIKAKALRCIDEIYPDDNSVNVSFFPVDTFFDEAVRWVIDVAPINRFGAKSQQQLPLPERIISDDGVVMLPLPVDFARIAYFHIRERWARPATVIYDTDPLYLQQSNRVLRGNASRPIVAICNGRRLVEVYSTTSTDSADYDVRYIPYDSAVIDANMVDITAWKLAEIVLLSMSDSTAASLCTARVNELLEQLAI